MKKEQLERVYELLKKEITLINKNAPINESSRRQGKQVSLIRLLTTLRKKIAEHNFSPYVNGYRLVGSAAAWVLAPHPAGYGDIDIIVYCRDKIPHFDQLLEAEAETVAELVNEDITAPEEKVTIGIVKEQYFADCVRVFGSNPWSLVAVGSKDRALTDKPLTVDLKFVFSPSRVYDFSIGSFEISLDALLNKGENFMKQRHVMVECNYGDFEEAIFHSMHGIIATKNPSSIQRGLLRYCNSRAKGFIPEIHQKEKMEQAFIDGFVAEFCSPENELKSAFIRAITKHIKPDHIDVSIRFLKTLDELLLKGLHKNATNSVVEESLTWFHNETEKALLSLKDKSSI